MGHTKQKRECFQATVVRTEYCGYWYTGVKAPGHQYPQCWENIFILDRFDQFRTKILHMQQISLENKITVWKKRSQPFKG